MIIKQWFTTRYTRFARWLAWKLPHRVVYWCFMRVAAHASTGKWRSEHPSKITVFEAMERWYD